MAGYFRLQMVSIVLYLVNFPKTIGTTPCNTLPDRFLISPVDILVRQDENAVFVCALAAFDNRTHSLTWDVYQNRNGKVTYKFEDNQVIVSTLTFAAVKREDYFVSCTVRVEASPVRCQETKSAWAIVHCFPTKNEITCSKQIPRPEDNIMIFKCAVFSCNPPVDMEWTVAGLRYVTGAETRTVGKLRVLNQEIHMTHEMLQENITCVVTSKVVFNRQQLTCTIEPFTMINSAILSGNNATTSLTFSVKPLIENNVTFLGQTLRSNEIGNTDNKSGSNMTNTPTLNSVSTEEMAYSSLKIETGPPRFSMVRYSHQSTARSSKYSTLKENIYFDQINDKSSINGWFTVVVIGAALVVTLLIAGTVAVAARLFKKLLHRHTSEGIDIVQPSSHEIERTDNENDDDCFYETPRDSIIQDNMILSVNDETSQTNMCYSVSSENYESSVSDTPTDRSISESSSSEREQGIKIVDMTSACIFYDTQIGDECSSCTDSPSSD